MAIAILTIHQEKLQKERPPEDVLFKSEIYKRFEFHPQALSDFVDKLAKRQVITWVRNMRKPTGGPAFRLTEEGYKHLKDELMTIHTETTMTT